MTCNRGRARFLVWSNEDAQAVQVLCSKPDPEKLPYSDGQRKQFRKYNTGVIRWTGGWLIRRPEIGNKKKEEKEGESIE
jgi:hypothetical protein